MKLYEYQTIEEYDKPADLATPEIQAMKAYMQAKSGEAWWSMARTTVFGTECVAYFTTTKGGYCPDYDDIVTLDSVLDEKGHLTPFITERLDVWIAFAKAREEPWPVATGHKKLVGRFANSRTCRDDIARVIWTTLINAPRVRCTVTLDVDWDWRFPSEQAQQDAIEVVKLGLVAAHILSLEEVMYPV